MADEPRSPAGASEELVAGSVEVPPEEVQIIESRDLQDESPPVSASPSVVNRQDLEPGRDKVRAGLAITLVGLLVVIVIGAGWVLATDFATIEEIGEYLKIVFTPVVGLVGSAVGFYYGAGTGKRE